MILKPPIGATLNRSHPLADGLVGAWLFNEGGGTVTHDLSGHGNHGALTNMDPATDWRPEGIDFARAGSQNIPCGLINMASWAELSIISLAYYKEDAGGEHTILGNYTHNSYANTLLRVEPSNDTIEVLVSTNSSTTSYTGNTVARNQWHQFGLIFKNRRIFSYADCIRSSGQAITQADKLNPTPEINPVTLGNTPHALSTDAWNGPIEYVYLFDRAISASEIRELYLNPYQMFQPKRRVLYFDMGAATGYPIHLVGHGGLVGAGGLVA